jgi:hypothetical protein
MGLSHWDQLTWLTHNMVQLCCNAGDVLQLNPVLNHTFLEAFLADTDITVPRVLEKTSDMDLEGHCGNQIGPVADFAGGVCLVLNWEQVARLEQIWARQVALRTTGPVAMQNTTQGRPQRLRWAWPPAADRSASDALWLPGEAWRRIAACLHSNMQLIYYAQAVGGKTIRGPDKEPLGQPGVFWVQPQEARNLAAQLCTFVG